MHVIAILCVPFDFSYATPLTCAPKQSAQSIEAKALNELSLDLLSNLSLPQFEKLIDTVSYHERYGTKLATTAEPLSRLPQLGNMKISNCELFPMNAVSPS